MKKFDKRALKFQAGDNRDEGIAVAELITLMGDHKIGKELLEQMGVDSIKAEFIRIPNAKALVDAQTTINKKYHKVDVDSSLADMALYTPDGEFSINFEDLDKVEYFHTMGVRKIYTEPIHSARSDFFAGLYQMDKYATQLIERDMQDVIEMNWQLLRTKTNPTRRYRILHDYKENLFYLRAITSTDLYHDYNNNIAIIVALLTLHNEMKRGEVEFRLAGAEYSESFIKMFFESSEQKLLAGIGHVKNYITVSNDEIKREALRFSGSCSIIFPDGEGEGRVFIEPKDVNSKILSIPHNRRPETANKELANMANSKEIHAELFDDIVKIKNIKKPETIKLLLQKKIDQSTNDGIGHHKAKIMKILEQPVSNMIDLLRIFGKVEMFATEDVGVTEYLRLAVYEILIKRGRGEKSK